MKKSMLKSSVICLGFATAAVIGLALPAAAGRIAPPPCTPAPFGIVGWWPGNGNTKDVINGNLGRIVGPIIYATGKVGKGFLSPAGGQGVMQGVSVPASPVLDVVDAITIEAWIKQDPGTWGPIVEYVDARRYPNWVAPHIWSGYDAANGYAIVYVNLTDDSTNYHQMWVPGLEQGILQHVAVTYDQQGIAKVYINGALAQEANFGPFTMHTADGLNIGMREVNDAGDAGSFSGVIDEASVYDRALTAEEIGAIYNAGAAGKCKP